MPTTAADIAATRKLREAFGEEDRGSCFGVTDPSRLRPPFAQPKKDAAAQEAPEPLAKP
jgi:hypothetical protein